MPRHRVRTTNHRAYAEIDLKAAVTQVLNGKCSEREVARRQGIPRSTIKRYVSKCREAGDIDSVDFRPVNKHLQVFTDQEEIMFVSYLKSAANIHYGLTSESARRLAYEFAVHNNKPVKFNWEKNKAAGEDWLYNLRKKHKLSLRTPEQTSLQRCVSFNKTNVEMFFNNFMETKLKFKFGPQDIYNLDETGMTTVHKPPKILAPRGKKQIGQATSAERGQLVTLVAIVSATGKALPPLLIFPRKQIKDHFLKGAPPGTAAAASDSGWTNGAIFLSVLKHFVLHERPSPNNPKLIILDNHESHSSIEALNYAKEHGIVLLTFPPHCSHKLQPLDLTVFGPLKAYYNKACNEFMANFSSSSGNIPRITIYDVAENVGKAFPLAFTMANITKGFHRSGIEPFNANIFCDEDYLSSYVSDRPDPNSLKPTTTSDATATESPMVAAELHETPDVASASTAATNEPPCLITPQQIRPLPKAGPRKITNRGRKKGKSVILTSTPIKEELESLARQRNLKKQKSEKKLVDKVKRQVLQESSSESEAEISFCDSSDGIGLEEEEGTEDVTEGDFLIVRVPGKTINNSRNYIARVTEKQMDGYAVLFYKRVVSTTKFVPSEGDEGFMSKRDIITALPTPISSSRARYKNMIWFGIDITGYSVH